MEEKTNQTAKLWLSDQKKIEFKYKIAHDYNKNDNLIEINNI